MDGGGDAPVVPIRVARRLTDRMVIDRELRKQWRVQGFSVSFDKLGATAVAWATIEWDLAHHHHIKIDRAGVSGHVLETYPAAAWKRWGGVKPPAAMTWPELAEHLAQAVVPAS